MEYLQYSLNKIATLAEPSVLKVIVSLLIAISTFFFGHLYNEALQAVVMLMVLDTILGVAAAKVSGEVISSKRFARSIVKGIIYLTSISAGFMADQTIPFAFIQSTMIGFVGVTEFISILENIGRMGYKTPKKLLNRLEEEYLTNKK